MAGETYVDARNSIKESKLFSSGKPFLITDLSLETGIAHDFISQVLCQMVVGGYVSKKRVKKPNKKGGIEWHYTKQTFKPRDFFAMSLRRHTNDELGLQAEYCWAVM